MRLTNIALALLLLGSSAGCALSEDTSPRDIPEDLVVDFGNTATGDAATGANRIYLLTPSDEAEQRRLRAVPRQDDSGGTEELIKSLFAGPNADEAEASLGSAIPTELKLISARTVGTRLTIDIGTGLTGLSDDGVRLALAQIVATASELDGVERVRIQVEGVNQAWPTGDGRLVDAALSIYDYPGLLETSQPAFTALPST